MMAEYIEREALLEALENADPDVYEDYGDGAVDWGFGRKNIQDMINGIPAADVAPVVHDCWETESFAIYGTLQAYWHRHKKCGYQCCDFNADGDHYCANCGAKMDGEP